MKMTPHILLKTIIGGHTFLAQALMAVAYARGATAKAQGEAATMRPNPR